MNAVIRRILTSYREAPDAGGVPEEERFLCRYPGCNARTTGYIEVKLGRDRIRWDMCEEHRSMQTARLMLERDEI